MPGGNKSSCVQKQTCSKLQVCLSTYDLLLPPGIKGLTSFLSVYVVMKFFLLSWIAALNTYVQVVVWHDHNCKSFHYQGSMSFNSSKAAPSFCSMVGQSLYDEPEHCLTWMPLWDSSWLSVTFLLFWKISFLIYTSMNWCSFDIFRMKLTVRVFGPSSYGGSYKITVVCLFVCLVFR